MLDFEEISQYQENNRIEAKKAIGGFPHSLWETYSAFANTLGGILLLGVEEQQDKSFHPVHLPDPQWLVDTFWQQVNDKKIANVNIMFPEQVRIVEAQGQKIVMIEVPRAARWQRPVYIGADVYQGTYRRTGEGDYRCSRDEVDVMLAQQQKKSFDMELLPHLTITALDQQSAERYKQLVLARQPQWCNCDTEALLYRTGVLGADCDQVLRPTRAGLLLLGRCEVIAEIFSGYCLTYRKRIPAQRGWHTVITTKDASWPGNLLEFYFLAAEQLRCYVYQLDLPEQSKEAVCRSLYEGLANGLLHADYANLRGIVISQRQAAILISNPGSIQQVATAMLENSIPMPRNELLVQLFHHIGIGHGIGSGLPGIAAVWKQQGWTKPRLEPYAHNDSTTLTLIFSSGDKELVQEMQQDQLIDYITTHVTVSVGEAAEALKISRQTAQCLLEQLQEGDIVVQINGRYQLQR